MQMADTVSKRATCDRGASGCVLFRDGFLFSYLLIVEPDLEDAFWSFVFCETFSWFGFGIGDSGALEDATIGFCKFFHGRHRHCPGRGML